jgi:membrane peptidoglycan carboxypeptidase
VADASLVGLVNAILTDRTAGVEQFGQKGSLHLSRAGYAVKTGTSRDFHDSWTVGYTGDYVVGVWIGNADNKPMHQVSGAAGAGAVWRDVMELMFTTPYYHGTKIDTSAVVKVTGTRGYSYGLAGDDVEHASGLLADADLITFPHDGDTFLLTEAMRVPLSATEAVSWSVEPATGVIRDEALYPAGPGAVTITATTNTRTESVTIRIVEDQASLP